MEETIGEAGVNILNIPLPTPEEDERRRKTDEALDAIAAKPHS